MTRFVLLVAFLALLASGQTGAALGLSNDPAGVRPSELSTIDGDLRLAAPDGEPVPSARVRAVDPATGREAAWDLTDIRGDFTLRVTPGRYLISVERAGFLTSTYGSDGPPVPGMPLLTVAGRRETIRLVIHREPIVVGVVRDDRGMPIEHATVAVLRPPTRGVAEERVVVRATTDAEGAYRVDGLAPGAYLATAMAAPPVGVEGVAVPAPRFFPGVESAAEAVPIVLGPDEARMGLDFTLPRESLSRLTGVVKPPEGVRLRDDVLVIVSGTEDWAPIWEAPLVREGRFVVLIHQGSYRIDIRAVGRPADQASSRGRPYFASEIVDVTEGASTTREFHLGEAIRVSGRVRSGDGPVHGLRVRFVPRVDRQAVLRPVEAATADDGRFDAEGLAPGRYRLELLDPGATWVLDAVRFGGQQRDEPAIDLAGPVQMDDLELTAVAATASVSGRVIGAGVPASSFVVGLLPLDRAPAHAAQDACSCSVTRPDEHGRYLFTKLRPGAYLLFLLRVADAAVLRDEAALEALRSTLGRGIRVSLTAGVEVRMDLRIGHDPRSGVR